MRESNFSFPVQNRAAVVISSQLYDRRALDSSSPLPLFNSLTHLTYLTSTSPRIREILTVDGGLERLVRLLREFCSWPPPPQSPRAIYGLKPAVARPPRRSPSEERDLKGKGKHVDEEHVVQSALESTQPPIADSPSSDFTSPSPLHSFDRAAAFRFSLAFQCVVNIGVRGSESVRARVVQAGMLDVVSAVLECWLVSKGFAVCPSPTGSGAPRESKEVRVARRLELMERKQREAAAAQSAQAAELARVLNGIIPAPMATYLPRDQTSTGATDSSASLNEDMMLMFSDRSGARDESTERNIDQSTSDPEGSSLSRRGTVRQGSAPALPIARPSTAPPSNPSDNASITHSHLISTPSSLSSSTTASPIPIRRPSTATPSSSGDVSDSASADTSANATPAGGNTPTGSIIVNSRDRSGTVIARPPWDQQQATRSDSQSGPSSSRGDPQRSGDELETEPENQSENDADTQVSASRHDGARIINRPQHDHTTRMAVIFQPDTAEVGMDMNMLVEQSRGIVVGGEGMGVEQGLVNLGIQQNDDLAMGAPPGAPGAVQNVLQGRATDTAGGATPRQSTDLTPRAGLQALASTNPVTSTNVTPRQTHRHHVSPNSLPHLTHNATGVTQQPTNSPHRSTGTQPPVGGLSTNSTHANTFLDDQSAGPYREEDVLLSLQLLAYLSKYPHVRQAFYKARVPLGPPLAPPPNRPGPVSTPSTISSTTPFHGTLSDLPTKSIPIPRAPNVFSLVERFTFRPSPSEMHLPKLPQEIQYWAGVIMRNACRKDEDRGGIRQCANMVCGKWETFPREFAKCRRCRKAKYCGKECQSKAWADGHRFWCSSRDAEMADAAAAGLEGAQANANVIPPEAPVQRHGNPTNPVNIAQVLAAGRARHGRTTHVATGNSLPSRHHHHHHHGTTGSDNPVANGAQTTTQPPQAHNVVVRLGGPRAARIGLVSPNPRPPPTTGIHQIHPQLQGLLPNGPRPRITQHAMAPNISPNTPNDPNGMDVDRRNPLSPPSTHSPVPPTPFRRRAGTLPAAFASLPGDVSSPSISPHRPLHEDELWSQGSTQNETASLSETVAIIERFESASIDHANPPTNGPGTSGDVEMSWG